MSVEVEISCPLGHKCETASDGKIIRCAWYTLVIGKDPQTNEEVNERRCAMAWQTSLSLEAMRLHRGSTAAIESMRNNIESNQKAAIGKIREAIE